LIIDYRSYESVEQFKYLRKNLNKSKAYSVWVRGKVYAGFWWGNLRKGDHWGDPGVDGRIILRWIFRM